ncbi:hypothetical protein BD770DRAFT_448483 [Pilaira anomala]|nr:hypothetical protein BD770DRAFT_448483 [Pilaira anomala]
MSQIEQVEYQDPILTPGNLRKIVQNLPSKAKDQHSEYQYDCDSDTFENEINEFFKYTEVTVQLQEYRKLYEKEYGSTINSEDVISLLDQLDFLDQESRLKASKILVHTALGNFTTNKNESRQQRVEKLVHCTDMLIECGVFAIIYQKLQNSLDSSIESDLYLTILYVLLESQRFQYPSKASNKLKVDMFTLKPNPTEFLFLWVAKLREKLNTSFPVKKIILLLWKSLLFISGGLDHIKKTTQKSKESLGLSNNNSLSKSTPQDLHFFQNEVMNKYPTYIPQKFPFDITSPLTLQASTTLAQAMGYTNATNQIELLYQTLFPPKSSSNGNSVFQLMGNKKPNYYLYSPYVSPTFVLPLNHDGLAVPESIKEAGQVFVSNMHTSLSNYQIIQERSKGIQRWARIKQDKKELKQDSYDEGDEMNLLEQIYANVISELQNVIIVLLKLLLTAVTTPNGAQEDTRDNLPEDITLSYLEDMDAVRNREVYSKAISGILLLLLKWTKSSHVLKFEYISQLLVDSGCLLLILKIIGLQEISDLVKAQTDIPYYSFLDYNINRDIDSIEPQTSMTTTTTTNKRNMFWAINYLRLLQMLTKHKTHRVMLLAQYKSSAILKRMLKISHPVLELYTLKLLKSQVPYLGRKWRSQNMRIVSAIYLNCHTVLKDDWISKTNFDDDLEEGRMQEHNLRILTYTYNGERYLSSLLPVHDELQTDSVPVGPGFNGFQRYEMDRTDVEEEQEGLDQAFQNNYKTWLDSETFYQTDDEKDIQMNKTAPDTPYPHQDTQKRTEISYEQLTKEINKIYIEQLNEQFNPAVTDDGSIDLVDEQELMYNLIQVQDATVQKWKENQQSSAIKQEQDAKYKYFLFDDMINSDENYIM